MAKALGQGVPFLGATAARRIWKEQPSHLA